MLRTKVEGGKAPVGFVLGYHRYEVPGFSELRRLLPEAVFASTSPFYKTERERIRKDAIWEVDALHYLAEATTALETYQRAERVYSLHSGFSGGRSSR